LLPKKKKVFGIWKVLDRIELTFPYYFFHLFNSHTSCKFFKNALGFLDYRIRKHTK